MICLSILWHRTRQRSDGRSSLKWSGEHTLIYRGCPVGGGAAISWRDQQNCETKTCLEIVRIAISSCCSVFDSKDQSWNLLYNHFLLVRREWHCHQLVKIMLHLQLRRILWSAKLKGARELHYQQKTWSS